jgi:hypothetical protein
MVAWCLAASAGAQVNLAVTVEMPDTATPGVPFDATLTIARTDASPAADSDVTAIGVELGLPSGWKLERDVDGNCAVSATDNQTPGVNSTIQVQGANQTYVDPPANTTCVALPPEGNTLEFFWLPEGGGNALPVSFPIVVNLTLTVPEGGDCFPQRDLAATLRYRVLNGDERVASGIDSLPAECAACATAPGDANGDGSVDPADAQLAFEAFLQFPEAIAALEPECGDFCESGNGVDPADAQGIFNAFLQLPNPCN